MDQKKRDLSTKKKKKTSISKNSYSFLHDLDRVNRFIECEIVSEASTLEDSFTT